MTQNLIDLVELPLVNGRTAVLRSGSWDTKIAAAYQEGQCVAFAVEYATQHAGSLVRIYWREDGYVSHAAVLTADRKIVDSLGVMDESSWYWDWKMNHNGESPESEDFIAEEVRDMVEHSESGFELLPTQNYKAAAAFMPYLPDVFSLKSR